MIHKYISSKVLIEKIYDEYNIQSSDFVTRLSTWTLNVLRQIKIKQIYVIKNIEIEYQDYRIQIPQEIDKIYGVIINGVSAKPVFTDELRLKTKFTTSNLIYGFDGKVYPDDKNIMQLVTEGVSNETVKNLDEVVFGIRQCSNTKNENVTYSVNEGWIHTNIDFGTCEIICGVIPFEYDYDTDIMFPLIPDNEDLKETIVQYCLTNMLKRGLKHHTLSLQSNNRYINPAMAYEYFVPKARNSCNSISPQARESLSKILNINIM